VLQSEVYFQELTGGDKDWIYTFLAPMLVSLASVLKLSVNYQYCFVCLDNHIGEKMLSELREKPL